MHNAEEMAQLDELFRQVWGSSTPLLTVEILMAVAHSGGYVSAAFEPQGEVERMLGASVGILARHDGRPALHSHITGLLPGARGSGLGRALKMHQRRWAEERDIEWIVWTFDPLVRRNAWFNIEILGARIQAYLPSFYGSMTDSINVGDESDRLLVAWPVGRRDERAERHHVDGGRTLVPTPDDIVELRRTDPAAVTRWRTKTREALQGALERGDKIVGFTEQGDYVIEAGS